MTKFFTTSAALAIAACVAVAAPASASIMIDWEDFGEGTTLTGTVALTNGFSFDLAVDANRNATTDVGTICDTADGSRCTGQDPDLESDLTEVNGLGVFDLGNVLIIDGSNGSINDDRRGGTFSFSNFMLNGEAVRVALDWIDFVDGNDSRAEGKLTYGATTRTGLGGDDNEFERVFVNQEVTSFTAELTGSGAIGDIKISVVPLPFTGLLLATAMIGGAAAYRRRKAA